MRFMKLSKTAWLILGIGIFVIALGSLYFLYARQGDEQNELNDSLSMAEAALPPLMSEKEDWENQLSQLESDLSQLESNLTETEDNLAQAAAILSRTAATSLPESVESIEYDEELFKIADGWRLEIVSLTASEPNDEDVKVEVEDINVEDVTFSVTSFTLKVKGEAVADILGFISTIVDHEYFLNATVELVTINIPQPLTEEEKDTIKEGLTAGIYEELGNEDLTEEERQELLWELDKAFAAADKQIEELGKPSAAINLIIYSYKGE